MDYIKYMHIFYIAALGLFFFQINQSYATENLSQNNSMALDNILVKYWSWWGNSLEDHPEKNPKCSMGINAEVSFVFFLNPFETGDVSYNCDKDPIPKGYSIMFPLLSAFCSQGDAGLYGKSYKDIQDCTLNLDRGKVNAIVTINDKVIVNISKDNGDGIAMKGILHNNLPQYNYYKEVFSKEFVDLLTTNKTAFPNNWEKPEEFENSPVYYKAVVHCECVIIDSKELASGNYTLKYITDVVGGQSSIDAADTGWKFQSNTAYEFVVK